MDWMENGGFDDVNPIGLGLVLDRLGIELAEKNGR